MKLSKLIKSVKVLNNIEHLYDLDIKNLSINSKNKNKSGAYFCLIGEKDGHAFYKEAIKSGAVILFVQSLIKDCIIPQILVENTREALSLCSCNFYGNPSKKLKMIGITGTNGKTTTSFIIKEILQSAGKKVGIIGTEGVLYNNLVVKTNMTTPDPIELNKILKKMVQAKIEYCVMEVSAHAIFYKKIEGIKYELGILTNLSQDHLDFFKDMKTYGDTKAKFLTKKYCKKIIVNGDDIFGRKLIKNQKIYKMVYGINSICDVFAIDIISNFNGSDFYINLFDKVEKIHLNLPCNYNIYNFLAGACACRLLGFDSKIVADGIKNLKGVKGRFDCINYKNINIVIDYAHTPDGIKNVLDNVNLLNKNGKIITVFGCGGNRDVLKRPIMGKIATNKSSFVILTDDNPRLEDPIKIIEDIENGIEKTNYKIIENRENAIKFALTIAKENDIVLILGKGAEPYQDICGVKVPYSDYKVVENYFNKKSEIKEELC